MTGKTDKYILGYMPHYEKLLEELPMVEGRMLEIGVFKGHSLQLWVELLPEHKIYGIDIVDKYEYEYDPRIVRDFYNLADVGEANHFKNDYRMLFDFIVEDASHLIPEQKATFENMFDVVSPGGAYVIEDLVTSLHKPKWKRQCPT